MADVNMAAFMERSQADGPGTRFVVWVQGCPNHCLGCGNPRMQMFIRKHLIPASKLADIIISAKGIDGVTFSGGEPFSQAEALAEVACAVRAAGLTVLTYSGHTLEHLRAAGKADWDVLLAETDLLIDGPFKQEEAGNFLWRGSGNQRLHYLTGRIQPPTKTDLPKVQVAILPNGKVQMSGFRLDKFNTALEKAFGCKIGKRSPAGDARWCHGQDMNANEHSRQNQDSSDA